MPLSPAIPHLLARVALVTAALWLAAPAGMARAAGAPQEIEAPLGCVDTVVTKALAPTGPSMAQGGSLTFRDDIAPGHGAAGQKIRTLYVSPDSDPVAASGDHVRVCLLQLPQKTGSCDPSTDIRGREFLVFDNSKTLGENAGIFFNAEHLCGGA